MLPNGDANSRNIDNESTVKTHTHATYEIVNFQSALDTAISQVRGRVPEDGNTLGKLYDYIVSGSLQIVVPDIAARDSLDIYSLSIQVFVVDTGNGWGLFKPLQLGTDVEYIKISDAEMLNVRLGVEALTESMLPTSNIAPADKIVMGNDGRLSDSRPPLPHSHSIQNITGIETTIDSAISRALSLLPVTVTSINSKNGNVTLDKTDVGLNRVDNTSDAEKPISKRVELALDTKVNVSVLPSGVLAGDNELVLGIDPRLRDARTPLAHIHKVEDVAGIKPYVKDIIDEVLNSHDNGVQLINGKSGVVTLTKRDVDLYNVDNTSDMDKPISIAQMSALLTKIDNSLLPTNTTGLLVRSDDARLSDARKPLPHMTESIVDFIESSITVAKVAVKRMVNDTTDFDISSEDNMSLSIMPELEPGKYTQVQVNEKGRVTSGSSPSTIQELGIYDVYNKTQVDNLFANIPNVLESNSPNRFVKLTDQGRIPDILVNSALHFYPRFSRFPVEGNSDHLYIDKETNTIYRFENEYVKLTPEQIEQVPTETISKTDFEKVAFTGSYFDLTKVPVYADIAKSGDYKDLKNKPEFASVAFSGNYSDLSDRPTFADIAWSGSYLDLHNTPQYAEVATTGSYKSLTDAPNLDAVVSNTDEVLYKTKTLNIIGTLGERKGKARWYPESNVTILYAYTSVNDIASSDIVCHIAHNLRPVNDAQIIIPEGEFRSEKTQLGFSMKPIDFLTVDIVRAVGKNLSVTIVYR
jgi:hypothetical protein